MSYIFFSTKSKEHCAGNPKQNATLKKYALENHMRYRLVSFQVIHPTCFFQISPDQVTAKIGAKIKALIQCFPGESNKYPLGKCYV